MDLPRKSGLDSASATISSLVAASVDADDVDGATKAAADESASARTVSCMVKGEK